ncbi:MAG: nucleotide sugar dehydrogenase, partial [Alphaproteobacteria bacterium]|nr:nucleotide sugar dehydrogenase [Alphaproteobacteria bacterium]
VGLTLATVLADLGFMVTGVEVRREVVALLKRGEPHFHEPGLAERLARLTARERLRFSTDAGDGAAARVFIITVGTPLDAAGRVRLDMIEAVSREVAQSLKPGDLVIMRSTVKLGTTRAVVMPILDGAGVPYDIAFCPERTLEGQALPELRQLPQIVGGADLTASIRAAQFFQFVTPTVVRVSSLEAAEMIKLVDNTSRDVAFAFANEIARICDGAGVSAAEVIRAGKLGYARTNLPLPGPVGGPCLEKDPHILAEGARECGIDAELTRAARRINERQPHEIVATIRAVAERIKLPGAPVVALLGIAFKGRPATDDLRGTMARPILAALKEAFPAGVFRGWDAVVPAGEIARFGLAPQQSLEESLTGAHLAVIANNHPVFAAMPLAALAQRMARPALIYDFWNNFVAEELGLPAGINYMALGSHGLASLPAKT